MPAKKIHVILFISAIFFVGFFVFLKNVFATSTDPDVLNPNNKIVNPSFDSNNNSWSVSAIAPYGWVEVPGNEATYGTSNFLVMKYEAKCADTSDLTTGLADASEIWHFSPEEKCNTLNNKVVVSVPSGTPMRYLDREIAKEYCSNVMVGGTQSHLINNNEWMTIVRNIESQATNWSGGAVGNGYIFAGHNDLSPSRPLRASTTDTGNSACAYTDSAGTNEAPAPCPTNVASNTSGSTGNQKRVHMLNNGNFIWDLAGNVDDLLDNTVTEAGQPDVATTGFAISEYSAITSWGSLSYNILGPLNTSYSSAEGIGKIIHFSKSSKNLSYSFNRGGSFSYGIEAGVFSIYFDYEFDVPDDVGFRCASDPVNITQAYNSSSGKTGGGNTVTVGNVADAKLVQSVTLGAKKILNFTTYVYNDTAGSQGQRVNSSVAQLYYNKSAISTKYTNVGGGWYKLSGAIVGANSPREVGVLVKAGKTVKVDDFGLSGQSTYLCGEKGRAKCKRYVR